MPLPTILSSPNGIQLTPDIVFICRRGNDSQIAAAALRKALDAKGDVRVRDVRGGLKAGGREVDLNFPVY